LVSLSLSVADADGDRKDRKLWKLGRVQLSGAGRRTKPLMAT
jgi:hypothetical protein